MAPRRAHSPASCCSVVFTLAALAQRTGSHAFRSGRRRCCAFAAWLLRDAMLCAMHRRWSGIGLGGIRVVMCCGGPHAARPLLCRRDDIAARRMTPCRWLGGDTAAASANATRASASAPSPEAGPPPPPHAVADNGAGPSALASAPPRYTVQFLVNHSSQLAMLCFSADFDRRRRKSGDNPLSRATRRDTGGSSDSNVDNSR